MLTVILGDRVVCEHLFILESERRIENLYKELLEYYTHIDYPFKIVNQGFPYHIRLKRGSHFFLRRSNGKWKPTLDIFLRRERNNSVALLNYNVAGISDMVEFKEKIRIEIEQFKLAYL